MVDVLIKPLARVKLEYFRDKLGVVQVGAQEVVKFWLELGLHPV